MGLGMTDNTPNLHGRRKKTYLEVADLQIMQHGVVEAANVLIHNSLAAKLLVEVCKY